MLIPFYTCNRVFLQYTPIYLNLKVRYIEEYLSLLLIFVPAFNCSHLRGAHWQVLQKLRGRAGSLCSFKWENKRFPPPPSLPPSLPPPFTPWRPAEGGGGGRSGAAMGIWTHLRAWRQRGPPHFVPRFGWLDSACWRSSFGVVRLFSLEAGSSADLRGCWRRRVAVGWFRWRDRRAVRVSAFLSATGLSD